LPSQVAHSRGGVSGQLSRPRPHRLGRRPPAFRARLRPPGNRPGERRLAVLGPSRSRSGVPTRLNRPEKQRDTRDGSGQNTHLPRHENGPQAELAGRWPAVIPLTRWWGTYTRVWPATTCG